MGALIAIGAGIAALTGIGAGIGIGIATSKATEALQDSLKPKATSIRLCFWDVLLRKQPLFMDSLSQS